MCSKQGRGLRCLIAIRMQLIYKLVMFNDTLHKYLWLVLNKM